MSLNLKGVEMKAAEHEWEDIGVQNCQFFQGRGVSGREWDEVFIGIGSNPAVAADDAMENAAMCGTDCDGIKVPSEYEASADECDDQVGRDLIESGDYDDCLDESGELDWDKVGECDCYYYVALYVKYAA